MIDSGGHDLDFAKAVYVRLRTDQKERKGVGLSVPEVCHRTSARLILRMFLVFYCASVFFSVT
jgi:hypothetical protein